MGATARLRERQARGYTGHSLVLSLTAAHASTHSVCNLIRHCATDARWETCTFSYDLSPMAVVVTSKGRRWYDFLTSLCAIIGGTFTVVGLLDTFLHKFLKDKGL